MECGEGSSHHTGPGCFLRRFATTKSRTKQLEPAQKGRGCTQDTCAVTEGDQDLAGLSHAGFREGILTSGEVAGFPLLWLPPPPHTLRFSASERVERDLVWFSPNIAGIPRAGRRATCRFALSNGGSQKQVWGCGALKAADIRRSESRPRVQDSIHLPRKSGCPCTAAGGQQEDDVTQGQPEPFPQRRGILAHREGGQALSPVLGHLLARRTKGGQFGDGSCLWEPRRPTK